jgi:hypothetical protein
MASSNKQHLVVIGAGKLSQSFKRMEVSSHVTLLVRFSGVIGLTTALMALESGKYDVTVVARDFPGDKKSVGYTSPWAGGKSG